MEILKYSYFQIYLCLKHHIFTSYIRISLSFSPLPLFLDYMQIPIKLIFLIM